MNRLIQKLFTANQYDTRLSILEKLSKYDDTLVTDAILEHMGDSNEADRIIVAETLSRYNNIKSRNALKKLLRDKEILVRLYAAESLGILQDKSAINDLIELLADKSDIVRIESIDSLGAMKAKKAEDALINLLLNDRIALVRGYAAESLAEIGSRKAKKIIQEKLLTERQGHARLRMYSALYMMGDNENIQKVFGFLKSRYYRIRCAAANTLLFIVREEDMDETVKVLSEALKKEKTVAVQSSIRGFFKEYGIDT